jgi:hypothetical protein
MSLVYLDYDFKDRNLVRRTLHKIKNKYSALWIRLFISPSGRGYHIKFETERDYSVRGLLNIRRELKDDPTRISMVDGVYRDVLFSMKMVDGVIMKEIELDVDQMYLYGKEVLLNG